MRCGEVVESSERERESVVGVVGTLVSHGGEARVSLRLPGRSGRPRVVSCRARCCTHTALGCSDETPAPPALRCGYTEHYAKIERENRLLLEKMSAIMQGKHGLDNKCDSQKYAHSLNKPFRKKELQKITQENQSILRRIQTREPT